MEGKWQILIVVFADCFVIDFHVVINSLFIAQMIVILHLTV